MFGPLKRLIVGRPIPTFQAHHHKLGLLSGLAILSSDALSSVAYATEEVLRVLALGGAEALKNGPWIAGLIALLLVIIVSSYRQTIFAYPQGGGDYIVTKENLGTSASLVTAGALLIDYTLTVAVSISAGVSAITSALPDLHVNRVPLALVFLSILMLGNLRGLKESVRLFGVPVYMFLTSIFVLLAVGAWRGMFGYAPVAEAAEPIASFGTGTITTFVALTAFANGCTAMTGVEAISDGVPAFREPAARTAARTLALMGAFAITMFVGISLLAYHFAIVPSERETVVSQLARVIFGGRNLFYYMVQAATALILILAANTAYSDFPRLAYFVARDRYMPRQFMNLGDKLAFSNGIAALSVAAATLIVAFGGDPHSLIPLYMIGVFVSFTLSQAGMFRRWRRLRPPGWPLRAAISGVGAVVTGIVLVIVAVTKAHEGAWIVLVLMPILIVVFRQTRSHYDSVAKQLSLGKIAVDTTPHGHMVIVPIGGVHRAVVEALRYASSLATDVRAVYVNVSADSLVALKRDWPQWGSHVKLVVLQSPYRSMTEPLLEYIDRMEKEHPNDYITVILPEFVVKHWWHHLLHNQSALTLKAALFFRRRVVTMSVPFYLDE